MKQKSDFISRFNTQKTLFITLMVFGFSAPVQADGGVLFNNIAPSSGITFQRTPSSRVDAYNPFLANPSGAPNGYGLEAAALTPQKGRGEPGVCLFDYDNDGDLDVYVTNGPGSPNSLYSNQLEESGSVSFIDVAVASGVDATNQDSTGCAFGDIDNDGDHDLFVVSAGDLGRPLENPANRLFENQGNGAFTDITDPAWSTTANKSWGNAASLGDVNNDGLLDIFVGNGFNMNNGLPIFAVPTALNEHNQLLLNQGGNTFVDISNSSGVENLNGMLDASMTPIAGNPAGITWAVAMVDIDLDGDMDLIAGDDQAAVPTVFDPPTPDPMNPPSLLNSNRGLLHIHVNDGTGNFSDDYQTGPGSWMGLAFGDFDSNGGMDFFGSNFGDANFGFFTNLATGAPANAIIGLQPSRWFLNTTPGVLDYVDLAVPGVGMPGAIKTTPFGWGAGAFDYDNDGDTDILYVGGINAGPLITIDNPLAILQNDGNGNFSADKTAIDDDRHLLANEHGMAFGDLNNDGFVDLVSASNFKSPSPAVSGGLVFSNPVVSAPGSVFTGPWDVDALLGAIFVPNAPPTPALQFIPAFLSYQPGELNVEINSADNGNKWVAVDLIGTKGITSRGVANRDGIGAVVQFTPKRGKTVMRPIQGGASHASAHTLTAHFGLGNKNVGTVEVLWPGGVRNRLYRVKKGEQLDIPEIPCSYDDSSLSKRAYNRCVIRSLWELRRADVINSRMAWRLWVSAYLAFKENRSHRHH